MKVTMNNNKLNKIKIEDFKSSLVDGDEVKSF